MKARTPGAEARLSNGLVAPLDFAQGRLRTRALPDSLQSCRTGVSDPSASLRAGSTRAGWVLTAVVAQAKLKVPRLRSG